MQKIFISDVTLRENANLGFKEKIEIAKRLDRLGTDVIETGKITNAKTDTLFLHTISPLIKNSILSVNVDYTEESIEKSANAISAALHPRLHIMVPASVVQMEYICHKKPDKVLDMAVSLTKKCASVCSDVEFSVIDATRSEKDFLYKLISSVIDAGATSVTVCDNAGEMLPDEFKAFISEICKEVPQINSVTLGCECSNKIGMASSCEILAVSNGVGAIKCAAKNNSFASLRDVCEIIRTRGDSLGIYTSVNQHEVRLVTEQIADLSDTQKESYVNVSTDKGEDMALTASDDIKTVEAAVIKLGYDLTDEDIKNVYDEFLKAAKQKSVGAKELDAIVALAAMQVAPTFKLISYVINNGNVICASAHIVLERDGKQLSGIATGDGPIDAAFRAIEQIVGKHAELDDFQIQAITEGREALGSAVVKLQSGAKIYSGRGISSDIIGSSINAYINALNKIYFEEA